MGDEGVVDEGVGDEALVRQIQAFQRCIEARDVTAAGTVLDGDYELLLLHPALAVVPRSQWLEMLPNYLVHHYEVHERIVDVDGDCATVLQKVEMSATVLGEDRSGPIVITDVWRRRADGWRIWRRHSTPLTAGPMPGTGR